MRFVSPRARIIVRSLLLAGFMTAIFGSHLKLKAEEPKTALLTGLKLAPRDLMDLTSTANQGSTKAASLQIPTDSEKQYRVVHMEFKKAEDREAFKVEGVFVFNAIGQFADAFALPEEKAFQAIIRAPGLRWLDPGRLVEPPPPERVDIAREKSRATPDRIVRGGLENLTGKGAIIAIVDSGLDFRNPDFVTTDADGKPTSRILAFWDTFSDAYAREVGSRAPVSYPNGKSIGTVYSRDDLNAELRSPSGRIPETDLNGHGTCCAGIAAGSGNNSPGKPEDKYIGVAPDADLIAVRIGQGPGGAMENSYLLGAIAGWIDDVAKKNEKPVVVSCSFGGQRGGRDGCMVLERQLDARFPSAAQGRAICIAAGNEGLDPIHAEVDLQAPGSKGTLKWNATNETLVTLYIEIDEKDLKDLDIQTNPANTIKMSGYPHPLSDSLVVRLEVPAGAGEVTLVMKSGKDVRVDAYLDDKDEEGKLKAKFDSTSVRHRRQVGTPGTMAQAITVGSYDWNDQFHVGGEWRTCKALQRDGKLGEMTVGQLSAYSSQGPSRSGKVTKPDIVAPGEYFTASLSKDAKPAIAPDSTKKYQLFNGTSAATPYTAGVVALMMQKKPTITVGEIKSLIQTHASKDSFTGDIPNDEWGGGKLDYKAVTRMIAALE